MLREIRIRDLGVIGQSVLELHPGLTVLTGETGAGKTMIVTGLGLLLGGRADAGFVRSGAARAVVEGIVDLEEGHPALLRAAEAGADVEDGLILARSLSREGRSRAHVGGRSVPVGLLGELGEQLVAVHGQADQWRLRRLDQHRDLLDGFGGEQLRRLLDAYRALHVRHGAVGAELGLLREKARERAQRAQALRTGLELLERIDPTPGEDARLTALGERLAHAEELRSAAGRTRLLLSGDDETFAARSPGVLGELAAARTALESVRGNDPSLDALTDRLQELSTLTVDLAAELGGYLDALEVEPGAQDAVQDRRAELAEVTRLYGPDVDAALAWGQRAALELTELLGDDDRIVQLSTELSDLEAARVAAAELLTAERARAADRLADRITEELALVAMARTRLHVVVRPLPELTTHGGDEVELLISSGAGEEARSITRAASGGELSRIMLAIEVAVAEVTGGAPTFVFDEVDAGVGGRAARAVGARLAALAQHAQVIVVTHLAQVAAHADHHLMVASSGTGPVSESDVRVLDGGERVVELARMLSGSATTAALEHARDLLVESQNPSTDVGGS